jgi:hypothetical protein
MVAPAGGGDENLQFTIKIDVAQAKKALEDIIKSEESVSAKTQALKTLMIQFAISTETSIEKAATTFKKFDAVFAGTTKSIIDAAAKLAKIQLLPKVGPTSAAGEKPSTIPDVQEEIRLAQTLARIKFEAARAEQGINAAIRKEKQADLELERKQVEAVAKARVDAALAAQAANAVIRKEKQADLELERKQLQAVAEARVNAALAAQVANEKLKASIMSIVNAQIPVEQKVQRLKQLILDMARTSGKSIETVVAEIRKMDAAFAGTSKSVLNLASNMAKQQMFPTQQASGFTSALSSLGSVGQFVFGSVLGVSAITVLRKVIDFFGQATDAAIKFNQTQFEFELGVRAIQRAGLDVTLEEANAQLDALQKKFPIFSKQEIMEGYGQIQLLTRGLHLTREELDQLLEVSITASTVLGRDFGETAAGIAKSLSSGWFEAAQRAGFLISRQSVVDEGLRMNIENAKRGYNAMTQYERALASLSTYVKENKTLQMDTALIMETQAGKVRMANAAWEDFRRSLGQVISPLKALGAEALFPIINFMNEMNRAALAGVTQILALSEVVNKFLLFSKELRENTVDILSGKIAAPEFNFEDAYKAAWERAAGFTGIEELFGDAGEDAGLSFGEGLEDGLEDAIPDAFQKLGHDIEDEFTKLTNRIAQIGIDLQRKLAEINQDYYTDLTRANEDYANDVEETNISFNNRRAEAERKYRTSEIDAEARFQEELRQLRTRFLFDLEDALRERDARQVLRLVRQYQMDKENITKEADLAKAERRRQFEEELRDLEAQRAERLRILEEEHQLELHRMWENWQQQQADAFARRQQEIEDAQKATDERIKQQILDFRRQYNLTEEQARALVNLLQRYFGTSGPIAKLYLNLVSYIMALVALASAAISALGQMNITTPGLQTSPIGGGPPTPQYAQGGTMIARKPSAAIFGEAGPERVTFTPLNRGNRGSNSTFSNINSDALSMGGDLNLIIELSPDLEAKVVNETLYKVSAVVKEVTRQR